ncbi:MAG: hypothetical protein V2A55_00715, partial [Candidatus Jorgensenbacteria bacterium]
KLNDKPASMQATEVVRFTASPPSSTDILPSSSRKPTTAETIGQLEGRLIRQLLRLQEDLLEGARINGIPCDCLLKHTSEMDITAEELQTMSQNPVYQNIRNWAQTHSWGPEIVAQHPPEFFVNMVPDLRELRKGLTEASTPVQKIVLPEDKPEIAKVRELAAQVKSGELSREDAVSQIKTMIASSPST